MTNTHGGTRKGAGRKIGSLSIRSREIANVAMQEGITPLEIMLKVMRAAWTSGDLMAAFEFAKSAAPYIHPRLQSMELGSLSEETQPINVILSDEQIESAMKNFNRMY